jgi:2-methylcitrate dehydratase PrpD
MSHSAYHHGWWVLERPLTPIGAQMNVGYAVAVAILDGAAMVRQFAPDRINRDDVWELIPRITAHHEPRFDAGGSSRQTRVIVRLKDGSTLEHFLELSRTVSAPLSNMQIVAKYRTLTNGIVEPARQAAIEALVLNLEGMGSTAELVAVLAPPVKAVFTQ